MAPLTILCGNNSSGKSSIAQFLLMLKQTVESYDRQRVLHLGDSDSLIDLGAYSDIVFQHKDDNQIKFGFTFDSEGIRATDASNLVQSEVYRKIQFDASVSLDKKSNKIILDDLGYKMLGNNPISFELIYQDLGKYKLDAHNYPVVRQKGRAWKLPNPENFFGFPNEAIAYYQNTGFLQDLSLAIKNLFKSIYYVGPLRDHPERFYQFSGEVPQDVGVKGKTAINALLAARDRKISRGFKLKAETFQELIARWLREMGLIQEFRLVPIGDNRKEYEVRVRIQKESPEVLITDVGFGVSQILPVLVQCFYVSPNSILFFEQPEIHLHPSVQSHLGDLFIEAIHSREKGENRNTQIIVESHSEHLIRRIQRRVAEQIIKPEEVAIYFVHQNRGMAKLEELKIDLFGNVSNWPKNFFGNDIEDLSAMTNAAKARKKSLHHG